MEIGQKLKAKRSERQLTQEAVAKELHVSRQTISNWEVGRSFPDIEALIHLSDFYHVSLDELLKGDKTMIDGVKRERMQRMAMTIFLSACGAAGSVCMIVNLLLDKQLTWSLIVFASLLLAIAPLWYLWKGKKQRVIRAAAIASGLLIPYLFVIEASLKMKAWVLPTGAVLAVMWLGIIWLGIFLLTKSPLNLWYSIACFFLLAAIGNYLVGVIVQDYSFGTVSFDTAVNVGSFILGAFAATAAGVINFDKGKYTTSVRAFLKK